MRFHWVPSHYRGPFLQLSLLLGLPFLFLSNSTAQQQANTDGAIVGELRVARGGILPNNVLVVLQRSGAQVGIRYADVRTLEKHSQQGVCLAPTVADSSRAEDKQPRFGTRPNHRVDQDPREALVEVRWRYDRGPWIAWIASSQPHGRNHRVRTLYQAGNCIWVDQVRLDRRFDARSN